MKKSMTLFLSMFCLAQTHAKTVELFLLTEGDPKGGTHLLFTRDYPGKYHDVLLECPLKSGRNLVEINEQNLGSNVFFQIYANGFQKVEGSLDDILNGTVYDRSFTICREREILIEYVISENGRTFDESNDIHGELWISDRQDIPIIDEDFHIEALGPVFGVNFHRVQDGYGLYSGNISDRFDDIKEAPTGPYVYENPMLKGKPLVFKICGCLTRPDTYAKIIGKEIRIKPERIESEDKKIILSHAEWENAQFGKTSSGEFVGIMNPPADRVLAYLSEFELSIPKSVRFENYADQENLKAVWMTINSSDLPTFLENNNLDSGATNITPRSEHRLPVSNTKFPNEKWEADYIIQPGSPTALIRVAISLKSKPTRAIKSEAYLSDAKLWAKDRTLIID